MGEVGRRACLFLSPVLNVGSVFRPILWILLGAAFLGGGASAAKGATLRVPFDYATIASAAQAAVQGDSILVWRPPVCCSYDYELITLKQGVTLRGMEQFAFLSLRGCTIKCLEAEPIGADDTTRVENLSMVGFPFIESIQAFSPRTSITSCRIQTAGPWGWAGVRVYKGAAISRNWFIGNFEATAIEARQGAVLVSWNVISALRSFALLNEGAPLPALLRFRNNTVFGSDFLIETGPGSTIEIVNNIFQHGPIFCSEEWNIRYNDFYNTAVICQLDEGNIDANPMYCDPDALTLDLRSPCVGSGENGGNMGAMGVCQLAGVDQTEVPPATGFVLSVHPNPVRSFAEFKARGILGAEAEGLEIYDADGRLVDVLRLRAGSVKWVLPSNIPGGVYFARVRGEGKALKFAVIR